VVDVNVATDISVYLGMAGFGRLVCTIRLPSILAFGASGIGCVHARPMIFYYILCMDAMAIVLINYSVYSRGLGVPVPNTAMTGRYLHTNYWR
jgi:hypothetical protein